MFTPAARFAHVKKSAIRRLYESAPPGSINLGLGEPDFPTPEVVRNEAMRAIEEGDNGYTPNAGLAQLRERVAAYHNESAPGRFSAASVCVTNGSEEAIFALMLAAAGPGDEVLMPNPGYLAYPTIATIAGAEPKYYHMPAARGFRFDRESFDRALSTRTKLVFVLSPSNPTGRVISREDLQFIGDRVSRSNSYVVSDEIYRELYVGPRPDSISEFCDRTIIVAGLSKMMSMTGWRLGWAAGPEDAIAGLTVMHQYISTCASAISQKAALAAFGEEGREATAMMRDELRARRAVMEEAIERELGLPFVSGEGAFYIMLDASRFGASEEVARRLLDERVITVPGSAFGSEGEGFLRLSFSTAPALIEEGIRRIRRGLLNAGQ
ncbi:MAG TPA: aminotransferase class I/II-fold pyridoxal phosphate-dependent enzyme [Blastocatellia bacterium]|nr:aminotransferase class I/II-fold pyridoxal phosphate-dependent enzyme [Blastocatellia bacterium]